MRYYPVIHEAYASLLERKQQFIATDIKYLFQGSVETQMTLLKRLDLLIDDLKSRVGVDGAVGTIPANHYTRKALAELIKKKFNTSDIAFGQLSEQFIRDFQDYAFGERGYAMETVHHYLAILKKVCKIAFKRSKRFQIVKKAATLSILIASVAVLIFYANPPNCI